MNTDRESFEPQATNNPVTSLAKLGQFIGILLDHQILHCPTIDNLNISLKW